MTKTKSKFAVKINTASKWFSLKYKSCVIPGYLLSEAHLKLEYNFIHMFHKHNPFWITIRHQK